MSGAKQQIWTLAVGATILGAFLTALLVTEEDGLGPRDDGSDAWPYLIEDWYDRLAYQQRGRWVASQGTPYLDEFSEYPQISTWLMALPYLLFDHGVKPGEPFGSRRAAHALFKAAKIPLWSEKATMEQIERRTPASGTGPFLEQMAARVAYQGDLDPDHVERTLRTAMLESFRKRDELLRNRQPYGDRHQLLMAGFYLCLLLITTANLRRLGQSPWWALLLLLPASLFFGFNRFDLVVTCLVALAIHTHLRGQRWLTAVIIGLAIMTKWYPVVLVPLLLSHDFHGTRLRMRDAGEPWRLVRTLLDAVVVPGLIVTGVVVSILAVCWFWDGGGWPAVMSVFNWHAQVRQPNQSSLLYALTNPERWAWVGVGYRGQLELLFKVLQLAPGFLLACFVIRTREALLLACLAATLGSMLFSEFFSPQWVIWVTALSVMLAPTLRRFLYLALALELVMYLQLPVFHHHSQSTGEFDGFWVVNSLRIALMVTFFAVTLWSFFRAIRRGPSLQSGSLNSD